LNRSINAHPEDRTANPGRIATGVLRSTFTGICGACTALRAARLDAVR
jgi:hypothetical protein